MTNIVPFVYRDNMVRAVEHHGEPWFVGKDVCHVLQVKNHNDALKRLDPDERGVATTDPLEAQGGRQEVIIISEAGVFRLIFTSRKPEAEEFKRWLAHEVLPALRRDGFFAVKDASGQPRPAPERGELIADASLEARVSAIRLGARLFGFDRGRLMWAQFGLPTPPPALHVGIADARRCLAHLLWASPPGEKGQTIRELLDRAIYDSDSEAEAVLRLHCGIQAIDDDDSPGFVIANQAQAVHAVYAGEEWQGSWARTIRRLPGTMAAGRYRFEGRQMRGTFVPAHLLDVTDDGENPRWSTLTMP